MHVYISRSCKQAVVIKQLCRTVVKMSPCFCDRLHKTDKPTVKAEYVFSGSLCRIREFKTADCVRYCITIFSLSNYKYLHFPHEEYKLLIKKLYALLSPQSFSSTSSSAFNSSLSVKQLPFNNEFKIKFGEHNLTIGSVTAFGLVKTAPFTFVDVFSINKNRFSCDPKWDICTCKMCPVFSRLIDFEKRAREIFPHREPESVICFADIE